MKTGKAHIIPLKAVLISLMLAFAMAMPAMAQRKVTPINNSATATQPINEMANDTARINAKKRATMVHYHDENGNVVYIDTITGQEWRDSSAIIMKKKKMQYPLLESASVAVDIWNPVMRAFGQHYGLIDFQAQLSLHNRYKPTFETGLGLASNTPADNNFTYKSPLSVYFRFGLDYNFLYNSSPDYQFYAGLRFGISPFTYNITNITINSSYWDVVAQPTIPSQNADAEWFEFALGLRVKLWGPISAGWCFRYHSLLHVSKSQYGEPWYIPGYGTNGSAISGSLYVIYTLPFSKKHARKQVSGSDEDTLFFPESTGQPTPDQINDGLDSQNPL